METPKIGSGSPLERFRSKWFKWFKPEWYKPLGQACELLSVIALVSLVGLFWLPLGNLRTFLAVGAIGAAMVLFAGAVYCSYRAAEVAEAAAKAHQQFVDERSHVISESRLTVLREKTVSEDVIKFLRSLIDEPRRLYKYANNGQSISYDEESGGRLLTGAVLLSALNSGLGPERTSEVKEVVLKYTAYDGSKKPGSGDGSNLNVPSQETLTHEGLPVA